MATTSVNDSLEGRTLVEVELRLPNNKVIPFGQVNVTHVKSVITESIKKPSTHELVVQAPTVDYVDNLIRAAQSTGTPKLRYRIGVGLPGRTAYLPWQDQIITDLGAVLNGIGKGAGHFCRMQISDYLFTASRKTKVTSRRGKISAIVARIAQENGVSNTVIEETSGEGLWIQSFVNDTDFIQSRMLPRAVSAKGRGNYNFYVQDNTLHFHTPDYQAALKELVYYQDNSISLTQIDESQLMLRQGASGARLIVYDPYTGQMREVASDPTKVLRLGNVAHPLSNITGADLNVPYHLSTNAPAEAENIAQSLYDSAHSQTLGLKLEVTRSIFLRVGDILRVIISPTSDRSTVWSGIYLVTDSCTVIESGVMVSSFMVKRGEFQTSSLAPTSYQVLGDTVIISDQAAPGQPLNLKTAQSSTLAHGAGTSNFTSVFVETQNRSAAPSPSKTY